ncbi:MAG: N-acetylglucosamine-6-phosphate deacetylase, partial [Pseudomonadota bacterium]
APPLLFLVCDAWAGAGTGLDHLPLGGRCIRRRGGQLRLEDGTLAGADLDLLQAVRVLVDAVSIDLAPALAAATSVPAEIAGLPLGRLRAGKTPLAGLNKIAPDLASLARVR